MNTNYNSMIKNLILVFITILLAYIIMTIIYFKLPKYTPISNKIEKNSLEYKRYDIKKAFLAKKTIKKVTKKAIVKKKEYKFLSNVILVAVYSMGDNSGFIIVKEKNKNSTVMLSVGDDFKGYKLYKVFSKYVIFTKNSKEYKLSMLTNKKEIKYKIIEDEKVEEIIDVNSDNITIKRDLVNDYIQNFDKIWDDISIQEVRTVSGIDGFKVNRIRKNSIFDKLGLQKNDIIKSVNNIELKSYNDAFKIYKKIDSLKNLNLKIIRDKTEQELIYEIK